MKRATAFHVSAMSRMHGCCYGMDCRTVTRHFLVQDESLEDSDNLPDPVLLAQEIVDDMQTALNQFNAVLEGLRGVERTESRVADNHVRENRMTENIEEAAVVARNSCPLCGSDKFTWGVACGFHLLMFKPDEASSWTKMFGGQKIRARRCASCGNIQLFALE